MNHIILPYVEDVIKQLEKKTDECYPKYSSEWLKQILDEKRLEKRVGKLYKTIPVDIKDYYRAQGYLSAVFSMIDIQTGKNKKISCDLSKALSQEILSELESAICKAVHKFLPDD